MKLPHAMLTAVTCLGCALTTSAAGPILSTSASASWMGDITRCPYIEATHDAYLFEATGDAEWRNQVTRDVAVQFDANAGFQSCLKYDGLDHVMAGGQFSVRRKFGLGPLAPVIRTELSLTGYRYRDALRNGTRLIASLSWSKRWNYSWQTALGAEFLRNEGRGAAYDYHNRGLSFETRYDLSSRWQLATGARRQWGDQLTYAWLGGSGASYPYAYEIWKNTIDITTFGPNWQAYTIDAHADSVWISLSPALDGNRSLPLRYEETSVMGHGESYRTKLISLSFIQRF